MFGVSRKTLSKIDEMQLKKRGNFLLRQELKNLTIECSPKCSIICNFSIFIIMIGLAIPILNSAKNTIRYNVDYTNW